MQWLTDQGVSCASCRMGATPTSGGRGVIAAQPIACAEVVVSVPDEAVVMVDNSCIAEVIRFPDSRSGPVSWLAAPNPSYHHHHDHRFVCQIPGWPHAKSAALQQALEAAGLCHDGRSPHAEALGLVLAVMAERCRSKRSRCA